MGSAGHRHHRAGRAVVAEEGHVGLVDRGEVAHVGDEHGGLDHVGERGARRPASRPAALASGLGQLRRRRRRRPERAGRRPASGAQTELARADQPRARPDDGGVGTDGRAHRGSSRRRCGVVRTAVSLPAARTRRRRQPPAGPAAVGRPRRRQPVGQPAGRGHRGEHRVGAVDRRRRRRPHRWSPSTGGMARAWRMPNDRMVRSRTAPPASTAIPSERTQPEGLVGGTDAVRAQHDLVERPARRRPRSSIEPSARHRATARPPAGRGHLDRDVRDRRARPGAAPRRGRDRQHGRLGPHRRPQVEGDRRPGAAAPARGRARGDRGHLGRRAASHSSAASPPAGTPTRSTPVPSRSTPPATGGRFGPQPDHVLPRPEDPDRPPVLVGQAAGVGADRRVQLPAEGPAVRRRARPARRPGRTTRRPARRRPARPRWSASVRSQSPGRDLDRDGRGARPVLRPCTLPASARASPSDSATA